MSIAFVEREPRNSSNLYDHCAQDHKVKLMKIIDISDTIFCRYLLCGPEAVVTAHAAEAVAAVPAEEAVRRRVQSWY